MLSFHPLKVIAVERAAEDAACVTVEVPSALRDAFAFRAGQYVTIRRMIDGREERRTYSIVTPPGPGWEANDGTWPSTHCAHTFYLDVWDRVIDGWSYIHEAGYHKSITILLP